jgi:hypothetical protein
MDWPQKTQKTQRTQGIKVISPRFDGRNAASSFASFAFFRGDIQPKNQSVTLYSPPPRAVGRGKATAVHSHGGPVRLAPGPACSPATLQILEGSENRRELRWQDCKSFSGEDLCTNPSLNRDTFAVFFNFEIN